MSITFDDVSNFIWTASSFDLSRIADDLADNGYEIECAECETHECPEHDSTCEVELAESELIKRLIERANQFGITDMLDDLKREGERVGVFLKVDSLINSPHASPLQGA